MHPLARVILSLSAATINDSSDRTEIVHQDYNSLIRRPEDVVQERGLSGAKVTPKYGDGNARPAFAHAGAAPA